MQNFFSLMDVPNKKKKKSIFVKTMKNQHKIKFI